MIKIEKEERSVISKMMENCMMDLDDMIFGDCQWQPSER